VRRFAGAVPPELAALDAAAIRAFLDGDAAGASTRRRRYATLCSFYRWLVRQEIVDANPMERVDRIATVRRLPRPLDVDTVARLLRVIPPAATRAPNTARRGAIVFASHKIGEAGAAPRRPALQGQQGPSAHAGAETAQGAPLPHPHRRRDHAGRAETRPYPC